MNKLFACLLLIFGFIGSAFADAPITVYQASQNAPAGWFTTIAAACDANWTVLANKTSYPVRSIAGNTCYMNTATGQDFQKQQYGTANAYQRCASPLGSAPDTTKPLAQQCGAPICQAGPAGTLSVTNYFASGPSLGAAIVSSTVSTTQARNGTFCSGACEVTGGGAAGSSFQSQTPDANGYFKVYTNVPMQFTGGLCSGGDAPMDGSNLNEPTTKNPAPDGKCPAGSVPGATTADGMTTCIGAKAPPNAPPPTSTTTKPPVTTTDSSGNTVKTQDVVNTNSDGSQTTTTTTTTTAPDGTTTTATHSSTGNNTSTPSGQGTVDNPSDKTDLCKLHPELNICNNSQVSGACALVTCTGDAIQCATLRAAASMDCRSTADGAALAALPSTSLGNSLLSGSDPMAAQISTAMAGTSVDLSNPNLDSSGFLGGGACFPAKTLSVAGRTFVVSFTAVCNSIQPLRLAVMACASILSYLIVARSVLGA